MRDKLLAMKAEYEAAHAFAKGRGISELEKLQYETAFSVIDRLLAEPVMVEISADDAETVCGLAEYGDAEQAYGNDPATKRLRDQLNAITNAKGGRP